MCGISGFYSPTFDSSHLSKMNQSLSHRGPDAEGLYFDEETGAGLGHRRLSILDLSDAANQPFHSASGRYVMVYNGEVYNFREIAKDLDVPLKTTSDTEVILEAFEKRGPSFVHRLNGMFAFAIYDKKEKQLFLFRDRMGIKPLYYFLDGNSLVFASELKALKAIKEIKKEINPQAVYDFLHLGYIPEPHSIYQNINKFPAGHYGVFDGKHLKINPYWKLEDKFNAEAIFGFEEAKTIFGNLIESSVKYRMVSDVPFGTFLSGGIDSSLVTAIAQKHSDKPIITFSIGFKESKYNEADYARQVSQFLGTDHHELMVSEKDAIELVQEMTGTYDEPFADSSAIPTMLVSKLARKHITMVLTGDGGDELFMGYGAYKWAKRLDNPLVKAGKPVLEKFLSNSLLSEKFRRASQLFEENKNLQSHIFSQEQYLFSEKELKSILPPAYQSSTSAIVTGIQQRNLSAVEKQALFDLKFYLKDDLLTKVDRASMKYSLEARVPLLDYRIVEFALNLDEKLKLRKGELKWFLKQVLYDYVPEKYFQRPKWGFSIPLSKWLKNDLNFLVDKYLSKAIIEKHGIVKAKVVEDLKSRFLSGKYNYLYNRIWLLVVLHQWLEENC